MRTKARLDTKKVMRRVQAAQVDTLIQAGRLVRKITQNSINKNKKPSAPGTPPNTRRGQLKKSILYGMLGPDRVLIGPSGNVVGPSGAAHEFGQRFRGQVYPKRSFMKAALTKAAPRLAMFWKYSIRGG